MDGIFSTIFIYILLLIFLWPQIKHKKLESDRLHLIRKLEEITNSKVVTLIHRQERISLFGIPFYRYIDIEDSEHLLRAIRMTPPDKPITLIVHTPGGLVLAATQIALALKSHPAKKIVIVPHYAMSGGTLIALAADEIYMDPYAVLGPLDPQLSDPKSGTVPAASIVKAIQAKGAEKVDDETLIKADIAEKAIKQIEELIADLMADNLGRETAEKLSKTLASGKWTHDYPLTPSKLQELGIPVKIGVPVEAYYLMDLYPQAAQTKPGVEYIPSPYYIPQGPRRPSGQQ